MKKIFSILCLCAIVSFGAAGTARSDMMKFDLNVGSTLPDVHYGYLTLTLDGSDIDVSIDLTDSGAKIINTGFAYSVAFNMVPAGPISVSGLPSTYHLSSTTAASGKMDGFGKFEYGIIFDGGTGGGAGTDSTLSFTISRTGGFSTVAQLVEGSVNPPGDISSPFGLDVIYGGINGPTGIIGTSMTPVPEPSTLLLLGLGLVGVGGISRKFRK